MRKKTIKHDYVTLPMPDGWEDASQVILIGPMDGGFRPNCVCSREPAHPAETIAEFAARQLPQLQQALKSYVLIHEGAIRLGQNNGFLREHTFEMENTNLSQLQFYVLGPQCVYTLTITYLPRQSNVQDIARRIFAQTKLDGVNVDIKKL